MQASSKIFLGPRPAPSPDKQAPHGTPPSCVTAARKPPCCSATLNPADESDDCAGGSSFAASQAEMGSTTSQPGSLGNRADPVDTDPSAPPAMKTWSQLPEAQPVQRAALALAEVACTASAHPEGHNTWHTAVGVEGMGAMPGHAPRARAGLANSLDDAVCEGDSVATGTPETGWLHPLHQQLVFTKQRCAPRAASKKARAKSGGRVRQRVHAKKLHREVRMHSPARACVLEPGSVDPDAGPFKSKLKGRGIARGHGWHAGQEGMCHEVVCQLKATVRLVDDLMRQLEGQVPVATTAETY
jgi:hypothetical protein